MDWRFWARTRPAQFDASEDVFEDDCDAIEPLLSLYGDGMASAGEARLVEAHLPGCESCRESLAWMQATRRALTGRPVQQPPADLHARIAEAIAASEAAPMRLRPARTFATRPAFAAAASLAAVGLFLGYSLTHLPPPDTTVKTEPAHNVAAVPNTSPSVSVTPEKHAAPAVKKFQTGPKVADNNLGNNAVPDDTTSAPDVVPDTTRQQRLSSGQSGTKPVGKTTSPIVLPTTAPHLKPIVPHSSTGLVAVKTPASVKHTPAPMPTKAPPMVASTNVKTPPRESDVQVLPPTITPQEPPAPERTASVTPSEPHVQNVDYIREIRAHLPISETKFKHTVGMSLRGISTATRTFGSEGGATRVADFTRGPIDP